MNLSNSWGSRRGFFKSGKNSFCKYAGHLLRRIMKSVRPCTLFMANFGKAEISLLFKPAASVPLLKMLDVQKVRLRFIFVRALYLYCLFQKAYGRGIFKRDGCTVCGTSTASHAENKCSTYNKYVSALFSANSLYLHRLFSKGALLKYTAHLRRCLLSEVRLCTSLNKSLLCKLAAQRCARRCILGRGCP